MAFYRIKEAADKIQVLPHVLRFWETQFPALKPSKTTRGQRLYTDEDVENFLRIKHLLYTEGYSISGAKKLLKEEKTGVVKASAINSAEAAQEKLTEQHLHDLLAELKQLRDAAKEL